MKFIRYCLLFFFIIKQIDCSWQKSLKNKIDNKEMPQWMIEGINNDLNQYKYLKISASKFQDYIKIINNSVRIIVSVRITVKDGIFNIDTGIFNIYNNDNSLQAKRLKNDLLQLLYDLNSVEIIKDLDMIVSLEDYDDLCYNIPIFSLYGKNKKDSSTLMFPTVSWLDRLLIMNHNFKIIDWNDKKNKCIWRGATSGGTYTLSNFKDYPRTKLVELSLKYPDLIDAKFNYIIQYDKLDTKLKIIELGYLGDTMSVQDQLKYKYQIYLAGNPGWSMRLYWQLFSESLIFKVEDDYINFFSHCLKPWVHFIPIKRDLSDLIEKLNWAIENDQKAYEIAKNARKFAEQNLTYDNILYYLYLLIQAYTKICVK